MNYACEDDNFKFPILLALSDDEFCCLLIAQHKFNHCRPDNFKFPIFLSFVLELPVQQKTNCDFCIYFSLVWICFFASCIFAQRHLRIVFGL